MRQFWCTNQIEFKKKNKKKWGKTMTCDKNDPFAFLLNDSMDDG